MVSNIFVTETIQIIAVGKFLHEWIAVSPYFLGKDISKHEAHLSMQSALSDVSVMHLC